MLLGPRQAKIGPDSQKLPQDEVEVVLGACVGESEIGLCKFQN